MSNVNVVCVDNIVSVNRSQIESFLYFLEMAKADNETFSDLYDVRKMNENSIVIEFKSEEPITISFYNEIVTEKTNGKIDYVKETKRLINHYYKKSCDGLMLLVDLCLDRQNDDFKTGLAMIKEIKIQTSDKKIKVVACTGVNELDRIDWGQWDDSELLHRRLTATDEMYNDYPAFDYSLRIRDLVRVEDTNIESFLKILLMDKSRNMQYFGEVILESLLLATEGE